MTSTSTVTHGSSSCTSNIPNRFFLFSSLLLASKQVPSSLPLNLSDMLPEHRHFGTSVRTRQGDHCASNAVTFVRRTRCWIQPEIGQSLRILVVHNSSPFYKRHDITSRCVLVHLYCTRSLPLGSYVGVNTCIFSCMVDTSIVAISACKVNLPTNDLLHPSFFYTFFICFYFSFYKSYCDLVQVLVELERRAPSYLRQM